MAVVQFQDAWYLALLGMAETFRSSTPPKIKYCLQCLEAVLKCCPPPKLEARTHQQLGTVLYAHTKNIDLARSHLEKASIGAARRVVILSFCTSFPDDSIWQGFLNSAMRKRSKIFQAFLVTYESRMHPNYRWSLWQQQTAFDEAKDVKLECISVLVEIYQQINDFQQCRSILHQALELSRGMVFWQCKFLFQLSQIHIYERDYITACQLLSTGADLAQSANVTYTRILFLLIKGMLLIIEKKLQEIHVVLTLASQLLDHWSGPAQRKESLKVFFLVLQVCHFLMCGQVKSVKPCLKQLQTSIQQITQVQEPDPPPSNPAEYFQWMSKDHLCILVYLVTVMHAVQGGQLDKAQKYTEKALSQIEKLKLLDAENPLLWTFQMLLLEHVILCRLVMGDKTAAIHQIYQCCQVCEPRLLNAHRPQLHTMLGLYAMSVNCMDHAEAQFNTALRLTRDNELWLFVNLNLAIVYLRTGREQDFYGLFERINPERFPSSSHSLRASAFYVRGLQAFFQARYSEAKRFLKEALKMANDEDLNRLSCCTLVLLGHIFFSVGNSQEALNMVQPAFQLASKIPDVNVQLWACALLKDLYRLNGDINNEQQCVDLHSSYAQVLMKDQFLCTHKPEHKLIEWNEGVCPLHLNKQTASVDVVQQQHQPQPQPAPQQQHFQHPAAIQPQQNHQMAYSQVVNNSIAANHNASLHAAQLYQQQQQQQQLQLQQQLLQQQQMQQQHQLQLQLQQQQMHSGLQHNMF